MTEQHNQRKVYQGVVVSDKMDKTIVVEVSTTKTHLKSSKHMMKTTKQKWEM